MSAAVRAVCFDASALVKVYVDEPGSDVVRRCFNSEPTKYTTPFCFYEALGVLKAKWLRTEITRDRYLDAAHRLTVMFGAWSRKVKDLDFTTHETFNEAKRIAEATGLDLSDAFQILSVRDGYFSGLVADSRTLLVTADSELAAAARKERLRVWDVLKEPQGPT